MKTWQAYELLATRPPVKRDPLGRAFTSRGQRFRLRAEVAKLQLERGQSLVDSGREAQLQWVIEMLDNQVQRLKEESRRGASSIGFYPSLWW